ncbi:MAG: outer membrane protein assembly factor BamE [Herbaspirillum sp.]
MRLLHLVFYRATTATFCLAAFGLVVTGCATKNPLLEDSPSVARAEPATATPVTPASTGADIASDKPVANGVQVIQKKRFLGFLSPYRTDIQQGNFVSEEMLAQLKPGMTQAQVRFALGTPLLNDAFHKDRWDYLFRLQKRNGETTSSHVVVFFENGKMLRYEGGNLPSEQEYLDRIAGKASKDSFTPPATRPSKTPAAQQ